MNKDVIRYGDNTHGLVDAAVLDVFMAGAGGRYEGQGRYCIMNDGGTAMLPKFGPYDPVLVDRSVKQFQGDGIYAFSVNGKAYIRMLQVVPTPEGKTFLAIPSDEMFHKFEIDDSMDFQIFGLVIEYWKGTRC